MRYFLIILLSIVLYSCSMPEGWEKIDAEDLPESTIFSKVAFANDSVGYTATTIPKLAIYKTINGGKNWTEIPTNSINGQNGSVRQMYAFKGSLVVLVQTLRELSDYILRFDNGAWDTIYESKNGYDIDNLYFEEPTKGYAVLAKSGSSQDPALISITGTDVDTLSEIPYEYYNSYFTTDTVYSFQQYGPTEGYMATSLATGKQYLHKFEKKTIVYHVATGNHNNELLYVRKNNHQYSIIRDNKVITIKGYTDYNIYGLYANKDFMIAVGSREKDAHILGVYHTLFVTVDGGNTWKMEESAEPLKTGICYLFDDNRFLIFGLMNKIYVRK